MNDCESSLCKMNGCMFPQACPRDRDERPGRERETEPVAWIIERDGKATVALHFNESDARDDLRHWQSNYAERYELVPLHRDPAVAPERGGEEETKHG